MSKKPKSRLLFVDSNILLDFYRANKSAGLRLLQRLNELPEGTVVTNYQVEAEVLRNRQKVMSEFISQLEECCRSISPPAFIADKATKLMGLLSNAKSEIDRLKAKTLKSIASPLADPVYVELKKLFAKSSVVNLKRDDEIKKEIKRRALNRFQLGYPPRKPSDTTIGDAFNWEWVIECARNEKRDVLIVTRDEDYGPKGQLNSWLIHEFKDRTSPRRGIQLFQKLTEALKLFDVPVSKEEVKQESEIIKASQAVSMKDEHYWPFRAVAGSGGVAEKTISEMLVWDDFRNRIREFDARSSTISEAVTEAWHREWSKLHSADASISAPTKNSSQ